MKNTLPTKPGVRRNSAAFGKKNTATFNGFLALFLMVMGMQMSWGQASITSSTAVTDALTASAGASAPTNWTMSGNTTFTSGNQTSGTTGGWYGNGNISFLGSGTATNGNATWLLQNNSGSTLTGFTLAFTARLWKTGANSPSVTVSYSNSGTITNPAAGALTNALSSLTFNDATTNVSTGAAMTQTVSGLTIANGQYIFVRFIHAGGSSSDNLGWDDCSFTPTLAVSTNYYSKSTGNLNDVANWGTATDGTGTAPTNFTTANQVFNIRNNATPTIGAAWTVSGSGSKIIVGDGTDACNFTIPALYAVTGTVDVNANATLTNTNTTIPTLGTLNATSTVEFNAAGAQTVPAATYGNLKVNTTTANATAGGAIVLAATTTLTVGNGSVFDLGANALTGGATSFTTSGTGTIKTQNTSATPLPTGKTWTMDVEYNGTGAQTIVTGTYNNVTLSTARTSSPAITLGSGTITIGNIFSVTATGVGSYVNTGNTVDFSKATTQTIPAINYLNITNTGNGVRTLANGVIKIASTFTPGSSNYTIGTSTVEFNGSSAQTIPVLPVASGGNYYNLTYSGNSIGTLGGSITVAGNFVQSAGNFQITSTSSASAVTLNVTGNVTLSNAAILNLLNSTINGASATLNVTGNTTTSGATSIFFETVNNSNASGIAIFQTNDFTTTSTVSNIIDFGISTVLGNEFRISGNFSKSGNGKFLTSSSSASIGFVFNKSGTQTFSYSGANSSNTQYVVNSGSTLQLLTSLTMGAFTNPTSTFKVIGTLDMGTNVISGTTNPTFTVNAGGTIITSNTGGLATAITTPGTNVFTAGASYTFNGATTTPFHSATLGAPANVIINANVTLNKSTTITNSLSLTSGTLTVGANTLTLSGSTINRDGTTYTGNIDASNASATVAFTNTSALTIPASTFTGTCNNITLNGAGGITLGSDLTIGGTLTFTSGKITTEANKVILTSAGSVSRTSGYVVGNLQKNVAVSATSRTFEIGDASNYTPITLALTGVTVAGDLTASTTIPGAAPASASGIHPTKYLNRYWTLTNSGIILTSFDPTFTFVAGDIQGSAATSSFVGAKLTSSAWTNPTVGTLTSTSSQLTGVTSFGDFYLGEPGAPTVTSSAASSISTTGAVLNGTVNDNGSNTTPGFDYGTTTSYGSSGTTSPSSIAAATGATSVTSTISSLSVNTQYNFRANATNSLGTTNGSNLTFYTLANVPGTPTVNNPTSTTLDVLIDVNSNPIGTEFAIQETGGNYVQANGSLGAGAVWQTASVWGTETVTGLSGGTLYTFQVKARNGDNTETSFGTSANGTTTSSVAPTITSPTATAILSTTATLGANVTSDGGATITARGVVWSEISLNPAPQLSGSNVTNVAGTGTTGVFTTSATLLPSATQISYSAYATNSQGTSYTPVGTFTTLATEPITVSSLMTFPTYTTSSVLVSFTAGNGANRIVVARLNATARVAPTDANEYAVSSASFTDVSNVTTGSGNIVVYNGASNTVTVTNLSAGTSYAFDVYEYNGSSATANYLTTSYLTGSKTTIFAEPTVQASGVNFTNVTPTTFTINWTKGGDGVTPSTGSLIIVKDVSAVDAVPVDGTSYTAGGSFGAGTEIGTSSGNFVVYRATVSTVNITNLIDGHTYHVAVFASNGAAGSGSENYLTTSPARGSQTAQLPTYYSKASVDPSVLANWNSNRDGTSGTAPSSFTAAASNFIIQNGHTMNTTVAFTIGTTGSKLQIESGGILSAGHSVTITTGATFRIDDGGKYIHNNATSMLTGILNGTEDFSTNSTFEYIANPTSPGPPSGGYGNLTINVGSSSSVGWGGAAIVSVKKRFYDSCNRWRINSPCLDCFSKYNT